MTSNDEQKCFGKIWEELDLNCLECTLSDECELLTKRRNKMKQEKRQLELALDSHDLRNSDLIKIGIRIALRIARQREDRKICSEDVWEVLRLKAEKNRALKDRLCEAHPTWMGKVFSRTPYFFDTGKTVNRGSHSRLIRVWKLKKEYL